MMTRLMANGLLTNKFGIGIFFVGKLSEIEGEDIIIRTSKEEGAKMVLDRDYIKESFRSGQSSAELVAGKLELAAKGYLKIYDELS